MAQTPPTPPDELPPTPSSSQPSTFEALMDALLAALPNFRSQLIALAINCYNNAVDAYNNAVSALNSANTATTQAAAAGVYAANAQTAANNASIAANAPVWVSDTFYAVDYAVTSPDNGLSYRRKIAGAGSVMPSIDTTNWRAVVLDVVTNLPTIRPSLLLDFANAERVDRRVSIIRGSAANLTNKYGLVDLVGVNVPRINYDASTGQCGGLLIGGVRTNACLYSRDLTNAAWVKSNCTAALTQTGANGAANSASLLTATANNATCLQPITLASSARFQTAYLKRISGSGNVYMTMDNGATWIDVTPSVNATSFTRVAVATQTLANPIVGFKLATSGDAIAVDYVQNEDGADASAPIETTSMALSRSADIASIACADWFRPDEGTIIIEAVAVNNATSGDQRLLSIGADSANFIEIFRENGSQRHWVALVIGGVSIISGSSGSAWAAGTSAKIAFAYKSGDSSLVVNGGSAVSFASAFVLPSFTTMNIGKSFSGGKAWGSTISRITYYPKRLPISQQQGLTQ